MIGITEFRNNVKKYLDLCRQGPLLLRRNSDTYILITKEHYVDLINKAKAPNLMRMPDNVHTVIHFTTKTTLSS